MYLCIYTHCTQYISVSLSVWNRYLCFWSISFSDISNILSCVISSRHAFAHIILLLYSGDSTTSAASAAEYQQIRDQIRRESLIAREERRRTLSSTISPLPVLIDEDSEASRGPLEDGTYLSPLHVDCADELKAADAVDSKMNVTKRKSSTHSSASRAKLDSNLTSQAAIIKRNRSLRAVLNVGGQRHEVLWSTLERIPNTRLGRLRRCDTHGKILSLCDDYDVSTNEYFFDRHPTAFSTIIDFYRTGKLHLLDDVCILSYSDELEFWGIEEYYLEQCCLTKFNQRRDHLLEEMKKEQECLSPGNVEDFGEGKYNRARKLVWNLLEKPDSSRLAKVKQLLIKFTIFHIK